uniref:Reverse transcriptase zinc-binding domain-containing protein n=1 Tax=Cannabis sativa TaxID=3483 RepID=A0A803PSG4_CANSA
MLVLKDPWLSNETNPWVVLTHPGLVDVTMANLLTMDGSGWDLEIIADLFEARDQSLICGVPLFDTAASDQLFWSFENSGVYSIKSAYNFLQKQKSNWFDEEIAAFWSKLWKLKLPSKVSNLLWRACTQCLPTSVQLKTKRVDVNLLCPICMEEEESVLHYLVTCRVVKLCWNRVGIGTVVTPRSGDGNEHWCPPHSDSIKINVDAALFERNQSYGFGLVARTSNGLLIEDACLGLWCS